MSDDETTATPLDLDALESQANSGFLTHQQALALVADILAPPVRVTATDKADVRVTVAIGGDISVDGLVDVGQAVYMLAGGSVALTSNALVNAAGGDIGLIADADIGGRTGRIIAPVVVGHDDLARRGGGGVVVDLE